MVLRLFGGAVRAAERRVAEVMRVARQQRMHAEHELADAEQALEIAELREWLAGSENAWDGCEIRPRTDGSLLRLA